MPQEFPTRYDPKGEAEIYKKWEKSEAFKPSAESRTGEYFSIVLPPPNVTGTLHAGHAVMLAIEDMMVRYHRMKGDRTLWIPGLDHAAIATQNVVEKKLKKENVQGRRTRHELGREAFLEEVGKFVETSKARIIEQTKAMGASLDWSRLAYTLDEQRSKAVRTMFVRMYEAGILYRGNRIVNWCPRCKSTLADDEVNYREEQTTLYTFRYDEQWPEDLAIATTRPETKFGDTAVAVHPDDPRAATYVGQTLHAKFAGDTDLTVRVIADTSVDRAFGTGVLGVTPAHSAIDADMAERHQLPSRQVIDEDGRMTSDLGAYTGMSVKDARARVIEELRSRGLIQEEDSITHNLSVCYRCETPVEPLPKLQWFVDVNKKFRNGKSLKDLALAAVGDGPNQVKIIPERFTKEYFHWMENLRDWCISRQIWFGHRIPVWYCIGCCEVRVVSEVAGNWYFLRHGQTDWNVEGRIQGHQGTPLSEEGRLQVRAAAQQLKDKGIDLIISSDLMRAKETAEIIARELGGVEVVLDEALRERSYGELEGKLLRDTGASHVDFIFSPDEAPPGGESLLQLEERIHAAIQRHKENHKHRNVVIVSHGSAIRSLLRRLRRKTVEEMVAVRMRNAEPIHLALAGDCPKCKLDFVEQDPDTLDTWFSSGMWTFSTLGWPSFAKATEGKPEIPDESKPFHPTSVLETGYDILFFWIARMILMTEFALETIPFKTVYLHGLVRDNQGRKMSKSLGNVIDPLTMSEKYGADAVRLALFIGTSPGQDTKLDEQKIAGYAKFVTKLWNIARYVAMTIGDAVIASDAPTPDAELTTADRWMIAQRQQLVREVTTAYEQFEFSTAAQSAYDFAWHVFADWYIETVKVQQRPHQTRVLLETLETILRLLHPAMPFVTEALWERVRVHRAGDSPQLIRTAWPDANTADGTLDGAEAFAFMTELVTAIRQIRNEDKIEPKTPITIVLAPKDERERTWAQDAEVQALVKHFGRAAALEVTDVLPNPPRATVRSTSIHVSPAS